MATPSFASSSLAGHTLEEVLRIRVEAHLKNPGAGLETLMVGKEDTSEVGRLGSSFVNPWALETLGVVQKSGFSQIVSSEV